MNFFLICPLRPRGGWSPLIILQAMFWTAPLIGSSSIRKKITNHRPMEECCIKQKERIYANSVENLR